MRLPRNALIVVFAIVINNLLWVAILDNQVFQTKQNIRFAALSEVIDYSDKYGSVSCITAASLNGFMAMVTDAPKESESKAYASWSDSKKYKSFILESQIKRQGKAEL
jgi:hypothetical protein